MRTRINPDVCEGNKLCVEECPEVYEIIDGYGEVRKGMEVVPAHLLDKVRSAVLACPTGAVELEGDEATPVS
jgi:ferredoxin